MMLASADFNFYRLQNANVLHQTPIEIKSDSMVINQTLAIALPQKSFGTAACPTAKRSAVLNGSKSSPLWFMPRAKHLDCCENYLAAI
jgi:hypothetical protein